MKLIQSFILIFILPVFAVGQNRYKTIEGDSNHMNSVVLIHFTPTKIKYNYKNCLFTIQPTTWIKQNAKDVLPIKTILTNNSNDTLRYQWVSTCWREYFGINNSNLEVEGAHANCDANIPYTQIILPHKSLVIEINIIYKKSIINYHGELKISIGLLLQGYQEPEGLGIIDGLTSKKVTEQYQQDVRKRTHIIWSNMVVI
jgi:hypothetical protein